MVVENALNRLGGIMRALYDIQSRTIRDILIMDRPTDIVGLEQGFAHNLEIFPILLGTTFLVGLLSLPFAKKNVPMEVFLFQMIKVLLFVMLIGPILSFGVDITNGLIAYMWDEQAIQHMNADLARSLSALGASSLLIVFGLLLANVKVAVLGLFLIGLYLRQFMVASTLVLAPVYGAFMILDFGPFKTVSRLPKILVNMTVLLLFAGVFVAGFAQVGIAVSGGFVDQGDDSLQDIPDIEENTIKDVEVQSVLAHPGMRRSGGLSLQYIEQVGSGIGIQSNKLGFDTEETRRGAVNAIITGDLGFFLNEVDEALEMEEGNLSFDQGAINRARSACAFGLQNEGYTILERYGRQGAAVAEGGQAPDYPNRPEHARIVNDWVNGEAPGMSGEPGPNNIAEHCIVPLILSGFGPVEDTAEVARVSPLPLSEVQQHCPAEEYEDTDEYIEQREDCIVNLEESSVTGSLDEWRSNPHGPVYRWHPDVSKGSKTPVDKVREGTVNSLMVQAALSPPTAAGQVLKKVDEATGIISGGGPSYEFHAGESTKKECVIKDFETVCYTDTTAADAFDQFMIWFLSMIAPIVVIFYSGYAALGPAKLFMGSLSGVGFASARSGGGGSASSTTGRKGGGGPPLRQGSQGGLGNSDPVSTHHSSEHHTTSSDYAVFDPTAEDPVDGPGVEAEPAQNNMAVRDTVRGASSRLSAGAKDAARQGLQGSPLSWAQAGLNHFKKHPPGDSPAKSPEEFSNDSILSRAGDLDELPSVNAKGVQKPQSVGNAVNLEGAWTFRKSQEVSNSAEVQVKSDGDRVFHTNENIEQAGELMKHDDNGNLHRVPWAATEKTNAGLEEGETYKVSGAVVRNHDMEMTGWKGNMQQLSPGSQTKVEKANPSQTGGSDADRLAGSSGRGEPGSGDRPQDANEALRDSDAHSAIDTQDSLKSNVGGHHPSPGDLQADGEATDVVDIGNEDSNKDVNPPDHFDDNDRPS